METEYMTVDEVAEYLKLNKQTVARMAARDELPAVKIARQWRFRREFIDAKFNEELKRKLCAQ